MPESSFLAACVQLSCTSDTERNLATATRLVREAAAEGAALVATPENTPFLGPHAQKVALAEPLDGPTLSYFSSLADELSIHLLIGSTAEVAPADPKRCFNTSVLLGPDGDRIASYRKIHLFDVDVTDGVRFVESDTVAPGTDLVVADTELCPIGMSVCYDLRFPGVYQGLRDQGAAILAVPSAFTQKTGAAHWHTLLKARAIENQCWVLAPGQTGEHDDAGLRHSFGHSLIINPWGEVVAELADGEGYCMARIDIAAMHAIRAGMPVAEHRRI